MSDTTLKLLRRFSPKSDINYLDVIYVPDELNWNFEEIQHDIPTFMQYAETETPDQGATGDEIAFEMSSFQDTYACWPASMVRYFTLYKDSVFEFRWEKS